MPAEPIIDMDVLLGSEAELLAAIDCLAKIGYTPRGNLGTPEREAFFAPEHDVPHHLYVCPPGVQRLPPHPEDAMAYADLKRVLALQFRNDRPAYVAG
jgi:GrpB-like predicted nucleotidyltransferase (UPF0157 family)